MLLIKQLYLASSPARSAQMQPISTVVVAPSVYMCLCLYWAYESVCKIGSTNQDGVWGMTHVGPRNCDQMGVQMRSTGMVTFDGTRASPL